MKKIKRLYLFILLMLFSCKSDGMLLRDNRENSFPLLAKVFNGNNRACAGVLIELSNDSGPVLSGRSDITGKVIFPRVPFGSYQVRMSLSGSESIEFPFDFSRADQALYGRLYSFDQLIQLADQSLGEGKWDKAENFLDRAQALDIDNQKVLWYRAILSWKQSKFDQAVLLLQQILENPYPPVEVHLFLADIYQYDIQNIQEALNQLRAYKNKNEIDRETEIRINELEKETLDEEN